MEINLVSNMKKIRKVATPVSFEIEEPSIERTIAFDTFAPIIDGKAEIVLDGISDLLNKDRANMQPQNQNILKANKQFKLISTLVKRKYE